MIGRQISIIFLPSRATSYEARASRKEKKKVEKTNWYAILSYGSKEPNVVKQNFPHVLWSEHYRNLYPEYVGIFVRM